MPPRSRRKKNPAPPVDFDWKSYYRAVAEASARDTALFALNKFAEDSTEKAADQPLFVVDLGCGSGTDTREFLKRGWRVLSIDMNSFALRELRRRTPARQRARLRTRRDRLEKLRTLPRADLVNASFALPFCGQRAFPRLWRVIRKAIRPGGRFAGTFFGWHDDWAGAQHIAFHRRAELRQLLAGFYIEHVRETESDTRTALGDFKHWHYYEVVARKLNR